MTHEQKIKALIEAGERLAARERIEAESPHSDTAITRRIWAVREFNENAANTRDSVKLLAEIAEAAANYRALTQSDPHPVGAKLDALLAKYKEAQDA